MRGVVFGVSMPFGSHSDSPYLRIGRRTKKLAELMLGELATEQLTEHANPFHHIAGISYSAIAYNADIFIF